jgi:NADH:ubiquinone oxidoreductase subunit 6 (subunit J)
MSDAILVDVVFVALALGTVVMAYLVFRTDSMVRASFWLLGSFVAVGAILVLLNARFLGFSVMLMMAGEMSIMAIFMVAFMMNPAGLNPMTMVHQHRASIVAGVVAFLGLALVGVIVDFPDRPVEAAPAEVTVELGIEELGGSMLVFQTAGATLLATMIGTLAIVSRKGRFGVADEGSEAPPLEPTATSAQAPASDDGDEPAGHGGTG